MSSETDMPGETRPVVAAAMEYRLRHFYWSVRRELWEHGAIYLAPLIAAGVALAGFLVGAVHLPRLVSAASTIAGAKKAGGIATPYEFGAFAVVATGLIVAIFYCLGALYNERRDRSILFWKSLPVSDLTAVLAKAAVPILLQPPLMLLIVLGAHLVMLILGTLIVAANGLDPSVLWAHTDMASIWWNLAHGLPLLSLWYAPFYAWLILASAWARRTPYLWAFAPPLGLALLERLALGTHVVWSWLQLRLVGPFIAAYLEGQHEGAPGSHPLSPNPASFESPHFWIGLILAAGFLAAAVRLRRSREPI